MKSYGTSRRYRFNQLFANRSAINGPGDTDAGEPEMMSDRTDTGLAEEIAKFVTS